MQVHRLLEEFKASLVAGFDGLAKGSLVCNFLRGVLFEGQPCHDAHFSVVLGSTSHEVSYIGGGPMELLVGSEEDFSFGLVSEGGLSVV